VILVSFVVPLYETRAFVREAVESALAQSHRPVEVVVVDDGSTDGGASAIEDLIEAGRIQLLRRRHGGTAAARNTGWRAARGEYLVFLDSDDRVDPCLAERLLARLALAGPECFAYSEVRRVDENGAVLEGSEQRIAHGRLHREGNLLPALAFGGFLQCNGVLVPRRLVEAVGGFDERFDRCEDFHLWLRLAAQGARARFHPEALASYRIRAGSKSSDAVAMRHWTLRALEAVALEFPGAVAAALPACRVEFDWIRTAVRRDGEAHVARCLAHVRSLEARLGLPLSEEEPGDGGQGRVAEGRAHRRFDDLAWIAGERPEAFALAFSRSWLEAADETGALWRAAHERLAALEARARELERALGSGSGEAEPGERTLPASPGGR